MRDIWLFSPTRRCAGDKIARTDSAEKAYVHPSRAGPELGEGTNGGVVEISEDFPFMLSLVEAFLGFFSRIKNVGVALMWSTVARRTARSTERARF